MKRHYAPLLIPIFALFAASGCQQEIELDLPPNEPELVIEGYLVDYDFYIPDGDLDCFGQIITQQELKFAAAIAATFPFDSVRSEADYFPYKQVRLTTTADYFSNGEPPTVSDAIVKLFEDGNLVETLVEDPVRPGSYPITHRAKVNSSYHLEIEALNNFYETEPEVYEEVPPLFAVNANYISNFLGDSCAYYMGIQTFEKPGLGDHYRWFMYTNNIYDDDPAFISSTDDANFDGFCLFDFDVYGRELDLGDTLAVFQMHTSEAYYNFLQSVRNQTAFVGGPFDTPPAPIKGNLRNVTTGKNAFGFFAAGGISANAVVVPNTIPAEGCGID